MTVSSTNLRDLYEGNASATEFDITVEYFGDASNLAVYHRDASDNQTLLTEGSDYSVDTDTNTLTYPLSGDPMPVGEYLAIVPDIAYTQQLDLVNGDPFDAELVEQAFDRLTLLTQQLKEGVSRKVGISVTDEGNPEAYLEDCQEARNAAQTYRDDAFAWAENDVDSAVSDSDGNSGFSALHHAKQSEEWATVTGGDVNGSGEYSAKEYAQGTAASGGTAKQWAQASEDTDITGANGYSALHWAAKAEAHKLTAEQYANDVAVHVFEGTATEGQDTIDVSSEDWTLPSSLENTIVTVNGVVQDYADLTRTSDTVITLASAMSSGDEYSLRSAGFSASAKTEAIAAAGDANDYKSLASEWASLLSVDVNGSGEFSAKEYAQGNTATGGTAKQWAQAGENSDITGSGEYSALHWATKANTARNEAYAWAEAAEDAEVTDNAGHTGNSAYHWSKKAALARNEAYTWAEAAEDTEVTDEGGNTGYSAFHWTQKAQEEQQQASTAKNEARAARDKANRWAEEAYGVEVGTDQYSAKHHATYAEDRADAAATAQANTYDARDDAQTARQWAERWASAPENDSLSDPYGDTGYSAFHHARKGEQYSQTAKAYRDECVTKTDAAQTAAEQADQAATAAEDYAAQAADYVTVNDDWVTQNAKGIVQQPRELDQIISIDANMVGVSFGPVALTSNARVIVGENSMWRIL